jgi:hypothetical protein
VADFGPGGSDHEPARRLGGGGARPDVAAPLWTFHSPSGPKGRFDPCNFGFWGLWNFSLNKSAAKSLLAHLSTRCSVEQARRREPRRRYSTLQKVRDFRTWAEEKPPAGTLYNYPPRHDVMAFLAGYPAPPDIGTQMATQGTICKMVAVCTQQGKLIEEAVEFGPIRTRRLPAKLSSCQYGGRCAGCLGKPGLRAAVPTVRIHLPPADSLGLAQTRPLQVEKPAVPRGCALAEVGRDTK